MTRSFRSIVTIAVALCASSVTVLMPARVSAQGSLREQTSNIAGGTPQQIISVNPFLPLAGYFQGEYERRLQDNVSIAVSGSLAKFDNRRFQNADIKLRLYPQERGLEGLGLAAGLGVGRARQDDEVGVCGPLDCVPPVFKGKYVSAPTFSVEGQYQWLLGRSKSTAVAIGAGVKRYFWSNGEAQNITDFAPTGRLTIGWAFR